MWTGNKLVSNWKTSKYFPNILCWKGVKGEMSRFPWVFSIIGEDFGTMRPPIPYSLCSNISLSLCCLKTVFWVPFDSFLQKGVVHYTNITWRKGYIEDVTNVDTGMSSVTGSGHSWLAPSAIGEGMSKYLGAGSEEKGRRPLVQPVRTEKIEDLAHFSYLVVRHIILLFRITTLLIYNSQTIKSALLKFTISGFQYIHKVVQSSLLCNSRIFQKKPLTHKQSLPIPPASRPQQPLSI